MYFRSEMTMSTDTLILIESKMILSAYCKFIFAQWGIADSKNNINKSAAIYSCRTLPYTYSGNQASVMHMHAHSPATPELQP